MLVGTQQQRPGAGHQQQRRPPPPPPPDARKMLSKKKVFRAAPFPPSNARTSISTRQAGNTWKSGMFYMIDIVDSLVRIAAMPTQTVKNGSKQRVHQPPLQVKRQSVGQHYEVGVSGSSRSPHLDIPELHACMHITNK